MVQFRDIKGNILDPQPSIRDVLRERMDYANMVLLHGTDNPEDLKKALEMLLEINQVAVDAGVNKALDEVNRYMEATPSVKDLIKDPRDLFSIIINYGSPYAFYLFEWIDYQEVAKHYRVKAHHDVMGLDGKVHYNCWPNADRIGPYKTNEIKSIRLSKRMFLKEDWKHVRDRQPGDMYYTEPRIGI